MLLSGKFAAIRGKFPGFKKNNYLQGRDFVLLFFLALHIKVMTEISKLSRFAQGGKVIDCKPFPYPVS